MLVPHSPLFFALGLVAFSTAQSSTPTSSGGASTASSSSPTSRASTSSGVQSVKGTTITLSANGTATATIVNGTTVNATTTPTSTSASAFPTLGGVSDCVVGCLQISVGQVNCTTITDAACYCSSASFRNSTVNCVSTQCPSELQGAEALAQRFCNLASVSLTFPPPSSSTLPTSPVPTSSGPTPTVPTGGAQGLRRPAALAASFGVAGLAWHLLG